MIKHTNSHETSDGQEFTMLEEAKTHEVELIFRITPMIDKQYSYAAMYDFALAIFINGPAIAEILKEEV